MTGFRISEILSLTIGQVCEANGQIKPKIGVRPRHLKGHYGATRWIPVCPELARALEAYLTRRAEHEELRPESPLFLSRVHAAGGNPKALGRSRAEKLIRKILRSIGRGDLETLSSHSLRKTWATRLYEASGHDVVLVKSGLGHSSLSVTQAYLACDRRRLDELILRNDWTRRPRAKVRPEKIFSPTSPAAAAAPDPVEPATLPVATDTGFLPGLEIFAA